MKSQPMNDDELKALLDQEIRQSAGYLSGKLSADRQKALAYYLAKPVGDLTPPEIDGRSSVVSTDVADTIEWMLPSLLRIFTASGSVVQFNPTLPGDEAAAKQATDYVNYVFSRQNPGFSILYTWIKDALLQKTGVLKIWWEDRADPARETYTGISEMEMTQLLDDEEVEPVEHAERPDEDAAEQRQQALQQAQAQFAQAQQQVAQMPPEQQAQAGQQLQQMAQQLQQMQAQPPQMLHDVTVKRTRKRAQVKVENVPPEEFLISRRAKTIAEATFVAHRVQRTLSDLRAMGYDNVDDIGGEDSGQAMNPERIERAAADDDWAGQTWANETSGDASSRVVWVTECYVKCDYDGDGIAEWRKVTRCGQTLLDNEECDGPPFVSITPIPMPHRFQGLSVADQAMPIQRAKTSVLRAAMDNLYLQVNGRYFAVDGQVNIDDLLVSRPGGVVRMKQAGMAGRLDQGGGDIGSAFSMLEYMETQKENRTGWTRASQGADVDALNKTATGVNVNSNRADSRIELIARVFSETGFKDLFLMILKLVSQHQDKPAQMQVAGKWEQVDPRGWRNQFHITVNVGLGTGNKDQIVQHLMALMQVQQQGYPLGVTTAKNVYAASIKLAENLQLPQPETFFTDPTQNPQPAKPDPEQMKMQGQMQLEQMKMQAAGQADQAKAQAQMQVEQAKAQAMAQVEQAKAQAVIQVEQHKAQVQAQVDQNRQAQEAHQQVLKMEAEKELALYKAQLSAQGDANRLEFERWKAQLMSDTQIAIEQMKLGAAQQAAALMAQDRTQQTGSSNANS